MVGLGRDVKYQTVLVNPTAMTVGLAVKISTRRYVLTVMKVGWVRTVMMFVSLALKNQQTQVTVYVTHATQGEGVM